MHALQLPLVAAAALLIGLPAQAASPQDDRPDAIDLVLKALHSEIDGDAVKRKKLLDSALQSNPQNRQARWQLGQVNRDGKWTGYAAVADELADNEAVKEYRAIRNRFPKSRPGQLELADWCRDHKLPERERAHLTAALALSDNPDDPVLRARLGFKFVDGAWTTEEEQLAQQQAVQETKQSIKGWQARISKLVNKLAARRQDVRRKALDELKSLHDPALIPVFETVLFGAGLERERLLVDLLGNVKSHRAADALARVAVFSNWDAVRKEAAGQLQARPIESYAPELIRSLRTPIDSRISLYVGAGGVHLLRSHVSETQYKRQELIGRSSTFIRPVILASFESPAAAARAQNRANRITANAAVAAELKGRAAERSAQLASEMIDRWNDRICAVLKEGTGADVPNDARKWWAWWYEYNQMDPEEKEVEQRYEYEEKNEDVVVADPTITPFVPPPPRTYTPSACLVAGTPVWTDRGFMPIEHIQLGDLVLSKHPQSGELSYKPVLQTTVRDEESVMTVTTGEGEICATSGHTFWISGRGWTKLRLAQPGERFHGAEGTVEILAVEPAGRAKTYNLVVADTHTYFVGAGLILSHDVTFGEPVDGAVPGLEAR